MKITLNKEEIVEAIIDYVKNQGVQVGNYDVQLTSTKGPSGLSAIVDITSPQEMEPTESNKPEINQFFDDKPQSADIMEYDRESETKLESIKETPESSQEEEEENVGAPTKSLFKYGK